MGHIPAWSCLMPDMIEAKIMQYHSVPIVLAQLGCNMSCHVVVDFGEVLYKTSATPNLIIFPSTRDYGVCTETKKLDVPSALSKVSGKSLSHVSSPYMTSFPVFFAFICASQVSWDARVEDVSASSKFRMTSRKEGMEPVVMALIRGMVIVGDVAWAVKGMAAPSRIRLQTMVSATLYWEGHS